MASGGVDGHSEIVLSATDDAVLNILEAVSVWAYVFIFLK